MGASEQFDVLGLGEVMLRLSPPNKDRLTTSGTFDKNAGGSELNVMSGVAMLGLRSGIITKIPEHALGKFVRNHIRLAGVSDDYLVMDPSPAARLGAYYYEMGVHPRKPSVIYDRANSSFTSLTSDEIQGDPFKQTRAFHVSGITLGLGASPRALTLDLLHRFKSAGALISFDVNYRANLWSEEEALRVITGVLPLVDMLFVSEETSRRMLRRQGTPEEIMMGFASQFGMKMVAMTMRTVSSPTRHNWDSMLFDASSARFFREEPYTDIEVVDRIGSGDAYVAGVLAGILTGTPMDALQMGNAMAATKNTVMGDMPSSSRKEIRAIIDTHTGTGTQSEMNR